MGTRLAERVCLCLPNGCAYFGRLRRGSGRADGDRNAVRKAAADYAIERTVFFYGQLGSDMREPQQKQATAPSP